MINYLYGKGESEFKIQNSKVKIRDKILSGFLELDWGEEYKNYIAVA